MSTDKRDQTLRLTHCIQCLFSAALLVSTVTAAPIEQIARPTVGFVTVSECPARPERLNLNDAILLTGKFSEGPQDVLATVLRGERRLRYFGVDEHGCLLQIAEQELPWSPLFVAKRRQNDGTDAIYLVGPQGAAIALVRVLRAGRATAAVEALTLPKGGSAVEHIATPPHASSRVELIVHFRGGEWAWAEHRDGPISWNTLKLDVLESVYSLAWVDADSGGHDRLLILGAENRFSNSIYGIDFDTQPPTFNMLKRIALLPGYSFDFVSARGETIRLWSGADSSLWDAAREERGPLLRRLQQLPDIVHWLPPRSGKFFADAPTQTVLIPRDSAEWWLFSSSAELTSTEKVARQDSLSFVVDFDGDGQDELAFISAEGSFTRLHAERLSEGATNLTTVPEDRWTCPGYNYTPGMAGRWPLECPRGYAVFAIDDSSESSAQRFFTVDCCPLPVADALEEDLPGSYPSCPEGSVATSGPLANDNGALRCSKVSSRYLLGESTPGTYWGDGLSMPRAKLGIERMGIPEALREGIGRESRTVWDVDGCIGNPPGSLLTGIGNGSCEQARFRSLLFAGSPGDPPRGTPVISYSSDGSALHTR